MAPPIVTNTERIEVRPGVHVIPDGRIPLLPNVGVVVGDHAALVVDTAMGPSNGQRVLDAARAVAGDRRLFLTLTHFHPEHGFGAQVFDEAATILYNAAQAEELEQYGPEYLELFRTFGPEIAALLDGVELVPPHVRYAQRATVDLGGTRVELIEHGCGHTRGDQVVFLPEQRVLFTGDLVEARLVPIFPPGGDADGRRWIEILDELERLEPEIVVPGHGEIGGPELIVEYRDYLRLVEERVRAMERGDRSREHAADELAAELAERYGAWGGHEWIRPGIESFQARA